MDGRLWGAFARWHHPCSRRGRSGRGIQRLRRGVHWERRMQGNIHEIPYRNPISKRPCLNMFKPSIFILEYTGYIDINWECKFRESRHFFFGNLGGVLSRWIVTTDDIAVSLIYDDWHMGESSQNGRKIQLLSGLWIMINIIQPDLWI
jgi:hypothetical protein